ncbi:hypothetical protein M422DRAFT_66342 [Sphaerobolus stellatus SS14]|nr:hypothetical protein M422DRAFT_66342 [Sphaerobolus stellatus SS14]
MLQLCGIISYKDSPGLIFHNDSCIPYEQFVPPNLSSFLGHVDFRQRETNYNEAFAYIRHQLSPNSFVVWDMFIAFSEPFVGYNDTSSGYILKGYVNVSDGSGVIVLEWTPSIQEDIYLYQYVRITPGDTTRDEFSKIGALRNLSPPAESEERNGTLGSTAQSLLWNICGTVPLNLHRDIVYPSFSIYLGDILVRTGLLEDYNPILIASLPCDVSASYWQIREDPRRKCSTSTSTMAVVQGGGDIRVCLPLNTDNFELVVDTSLDLYPDKFIWSKLARAYVSQVMHLCSKFDWRYGGHDISLGIVTGFSWHLQIPKIVIHGEEHADVKELYLFIETLHLNAEIPETYWSLDPTGSEKLTSSELVSFGVHPDSVKAFQTLNVCNIPIESFDTIWEIHKKFDLDPESNQTARLLDLPLMEFYGLEYEGWYSLIILIGSILITHSINQLESDGEGGSSSDYSYLNTTDSEDEHVESWTVNDLR